MNANELKGWLSENGVSEVSCLAPDMNGAARGKSMTPALFSSTLDNQNLRIPEATYAINVHGDFTMNEFVDETEKDAILIPDLSTLHIAPWAKDKTACVICDGFSVDGAPSPIAPRQILKNIIERYNTLGLDPVVGPEVEFYLIKKYKDTILEPEPPKGASGLAEFGQHAFSLDAIDEFDGFFETLYEFAKVQDIPVDTIVHEEGTCQFEINLKHGNALEVADKLFLFKRLARHAAKRHGIFVTFMAKPYADDCGSSMHLHQSLVERETRRNVFANDDGSDSEFFSYYIGGIQNHMNEAMPLIAPYTNSFNRYQAYMSAPTNLHWSRENRSVGLRVPQTAAPARRVENRIPGSDVNPYLAIAASLVCGLIGIENRQERTAEFIGQSAEDKRQALPKTLREALGQFRASEILRDYLGEAFVKTFADVKQAEQENRSSVLSPWDVRYLMVNV
ncbi:MAG: glutamine synthetase family protein [Pseudomonadota bacterium]